MPENKKIKAKKVLPVIVLGASFYYSYLFAIGIVVGYVVCKLFYINFVEKGKVDLVFVDCWKWKIHIHHWIMGVIFLGFVWIIDWFYPPSFFAGAVFGIMAHDIYDFNDWYKVVLKKETCEEVAA